MSLVTFYSENHKIFGNLHLPYKNAPCIVCLHGLESSKDSGKWLALSSRLCGEGYTCLRFNFRGCGEGMEKSEGEFEDTSLTSRINDYQSALDFLQDTKKLDASRLGVVGSSFGGMVALVAQDKRVKVIVVLATPYKIPRFDRPLTPKEIGGYYFLPSGRKFKKSFYEDLKKYDLLIAVKDSPPLLIIQGDSDDIVPLEHAYRLYDEASEPKKLEVVERADHVFSKPEHLNKVIGLTLAWFKKHL
ncbi:MAG: alpha/beta fold hydrolase [Candidatus Methylarchaceae archaeon HK02M1]|nr:alpha/beta fold hydrolase [Candidatus Methylarchaceae archaeon HK01M]MCP8311946.1 alpha/beta fold hydrolase [Candidatus Methylarchaceae archaeon HK02M1]